VGKIGERCNYSSTDIYYPKVTGIDRRTHWEVPKGCRPQMVMMGGADTNGYYMNDVWFYDIWNSTWGNAVVYGGGMWDQYFPPVRKFPSINVYRPDEMFHPPGAPSDCVSHDKRGRLLPAKFCNPAKGGRMYTELIYVMGGWQLPPIGPQQDCWGYSREYGQWVDLKPIGEYHLYISIGLVYNCIFI